MNSTPLWVPLVVAGLGIVSTLVGIVVTQLLANKRERATWTRELVREQARWAREDQALTFEHRRTAYVEFYAVLRKMMLRVYDHGMGHSDNEGAELPSGWHTEAGEAVRRLEVYGSPEVTEAAINAWEAAYHWGSFTRYKQDNDEFQINQDAADNTQIALLEAIRSDLHLTGRPEHGWF
jgi:hypothetical protein